MHYTKHLSPNLTDPAGGAAHEQLWPESWLIYPIVDNLVAAEAFLEAGVGILQFRHKGFWSRDVFGVAETISRFCTEAKAQFIIDDRADYARILKAGLHLGQEDLLPADARSIIGPDAMIGFSTHNALQMTAAVNEPVDYVAFGPVFPTSSKENPDPTTGIKGMKTVRALTSRPLVAIGGITRENAALCWHAGADSVAVIADLIPDPCNKQTLRARMDEWLRLANQTRNP